MKLSDLKYLLSYAFPIIFILSIRLGSSWAWFTVLAAFVVVPILELFIKGKESNLAESEILSKAEHFYFSLLLFINLPIIAYVRYTVFSLQTFQNYNWFEFTGLIISLGIILSSNGINVAHELGHKSSKLHQFAAKLLLIPSHYTHFTIEHNKGHHLLVGTPFDPATAKKGELLYSFWWRSSILGYLDAWKL